MGQAASKKYDSLTFGHVGGPEGIDRAEIASSSAFDNTDLLLDRPDLYGLAPPPLDTAKQDGTHSSHHNEQEHSIPRADSGYVTSQDLTVLDSESSTNNLTDDLAYVDATYYSDIKPMITQTYQPRDTERLTFASAFADGNMLECRLSRANLVQLDTKVQLLSMLQKLDLSHNSLTCLPDAIGSLQQLQLLNVAHNRLTEIPDTICHLARLTDMDVSHNNIRELTPFIGHLKKLRTLNASANQLDCLPVQIGGLVNLAALCVSHNSQLRNLPAEIMQLPYLRNISFSNCPLSQTQSLKHDPPSLFEICARVAVTQLNSAGEHRNIPEHLVKYLDTAKPCTACGQPYFKEYVSRLRLAEKSENIVPIEYRLCSAHWSDDNDRVLYMFARPPASNIVRDYPRRLPSLDNSVATHRAHLQISSSSTSNSVGGQQQEDSNKALWKPQRFIKVMNRNRSGFLSSKG